MKMPSLTIDTTPAVPPSHELRGWNELNTWANHNHAMWRAITMRAARSGMSEMDTMKMLLAELLQDNITLKGE